MCARKVGDEICDVRACVHGRGEVRARACDGMRERRGASVREVKREREEREREREREARERGRERERESERERETERPHAFVYT